SVHASALWHHWPDRGMVLGARGELRESERTHSAGGREGDAVPPATTLVEEYRMTYRPRTSRRGRVLAAVLAGVGIAACSPSEHPGHSRDEGASAPPTTAALAQRLVERMGGIDALNGVETL